MRTVWIALAIWMAPVVALACEGKVAVCPGKQDGFALIRGSVPATVYVDADAPPPVRRVAQDFVADLERVSGRKPALVGTLDGVKGPVVVIGQIGTSAVIDGLIAKGQLDTAAIAGRWEGYVQQVVTLPGKGQALVIVGSDPRGAVYGTYDISAKMGVSPWYWWADVPVTHRDDVTVTAGTRSDAPAVKYRGFFINDEEPALGNWAREKFGGINAEFYGHVFELNLRLKGNYLWPAMWGKAIFDDDPATLALTDTYGVVLSTSHHEPMTRAQEEWHRHKEDGVRGGKWDYTTNADNLRTFWRGGIERTMCPSSDSGSPRKVCHEQVITVGMRGDGDEPMSEGTATQLLETIVADQRKIIADVTGKPASETPQVWALYKEVQNYYDHGMQVPDDVTLLFADDNWGQIRRLPKAGTPKRAGGYGVYYHFDYVGGPRNYKWLNTNQIEKVWQQMNLAYDSGVDRLWIVNVGDIKPMEYPLSFFLDMAWNPKAMTPEALRAYPKQWATQQFGPEHGAQIGEFLRESSQYLAYRKPELIDASLFKAYPDFSYIRDDFHYLSARSEMLMAKLDTSSQAAYFQLVHHPIKAGANLYQLYNAVARNHVLAEANDPVANRWADVAREAFAHDKAITAQYHAILGGKWNHMMSQTHIGYTYWQQPETDVMPELKYVDVSGAPPITPNPASSADDSALREHRYREGYEVRAHYQYDAKVEVAGITWQGIRSLGRERSAMITLPQAAPPTDVTQGMRLEYSMTTSKDADALLYIYLVPTLDTQGQGGLRFGVSIDDGPVQVLSFDLRPDTPEWEKAVKDNAQVMKAAFPGLKAGKHKVRFYRIDGNVVLDKLVLDYGGLGPSYLGPRSENIMY